MGVFVYRNSNNGDEVAYQRRRARLDRLANWELVSAPTDPTPEPASTGGEQVLRRPGKAESKAVWATYIAATTDLSDAEAQDLTKAELVALADEK